MTLRLAIAFTLAWRLWAQTGLHWPVLGFVYDSTVAGLRPIRGIPGAAVLGESLNLGRPLKWAALSPKQDYALAIASDSEMMAVRLAGTNFPFTTMKDVRSRADMVAFSASGSVVALHSRTESRVRILTGLPDVPAIARELNFSSLPGSLTSMAISDDGRTLLAGLSTGALLVFSGEGDPRLITTLRQATAVAFLNKSKAALAVDRVLNRVYLIRDVHRSTDAVAIAAEREGIQGPVAVAVSGDNRTAYIANSRSKTVTVLDLFSERSIVVPCPCALTGLQKLNGDSVFLLTGSLNGPMWVFDGDGAHPRIVFVPAAQHPQ